MRILILSDLHIEFEAFEIDSSNVDVVVLAGDIHVKEHGFHWAVTKVKDIPVIYVLGNHEFYGKAYPRLITRLKELSKESNIHILEKDVICLDGVNFLGCTLWTDFQLLGDAKMAGSECQEIMTDYRRIRVSPTFSKLRSIDVAAIHWQSRAWLCGELEKLDKQRCIVVTHHSPSVKSLPPHYKGQMISSAYASDLEHIIEKYTPDFWIHGHLHNSSNYTVGQTQIICNPRGYPDERNIDFNGQYVIEI